MRHIREVLESITHLKPGKSICLNCDTEIDFAPGQYGRSCPKCMTYITIPPTKVIKTETVIPRCFLCEDNGFVIFPVQEGVLVSDLLAKCFCEAGMKRVENWPSISNAKEVADLGHLEWRRMNEWYKRHPDAKKGE